MWLSEKSGEAFRWPFLHIWFIKISDIEHQLALINEFGFSHECIDETAKSTTGTIVNRLEFDDLVFRFPLETFYDSDCSPYVYNFRCKIYELCMNPYWRGFSIKGYYFHRYKKISFFSIILKVTWVDILWRYSMNEKCGSKQTNFERTWIRNEKFTILN